MVNIAKKGSATAQSGNSEDNIIWNTNKVIRKIESTSTNLRHTKNKEKG